MDIHSLTSGITQRWYKNEKWAALLVHRALNTFAISEDIEIGVAIFRRPNTGENDPIYLGNVVTDFSDQTVNYIEGSGPPSGDWAFSGYIHTHGQGSNDFSTLDWNKGRTVGMGGNVWLSSPDRQLREISYFGYTAAGSRGNWRDFIVIVH